MLLHVVFLQLHAVDRLEDVLHEHLVAAEHGVEHRQPLGVGQRDALVEAHRGNLHQQRGLSLLVWQFEIVP